MQKQKERIEWRWELEEPRKEIIVPTLKEKIELGLTNEEWILICYTKYKNSKCAREIGAHKLCDDCPKATKIEIGEERAKEIETLIAKIRKKLVSRRR